MQQKSHVKVYEIDSFYVYIYEQICLLNPFIWSLIIAKEVAELRSSCTKSDLRWHLSPSSSSWQVCNCTASQFQILIKDFSNFANRPKMLIEIKPVIDTLVGIRGQRWKEVRSILTPTFRFVVSNSTCPSFYDCL